MITRERLVEMLEEPLLVHLESADELVDTLAALLTVKEAAELTDHRCLKYGVLPAKKTCAEIDSWNRDHDLSCLNCKLVKALAAVKEDA